MPGTENNKNTEKIFVVDDDPAVRSALGRLFRAAGRNCETFSSSREFLDRLPGAGAGCLVLDVSMPGMSGTELQERMQEDGIDLPIIFLTGYGDVPTSVKAMKKGAVDFLVKPVDDELLLRTVNDAIMLHATAQARHGERQEFMARLSLLSSREREVMEHVIRGRLNKQIAADLDISLKTVKVHRGRMMAKLTCRSVAALVHACQLAGIHPQTQVAP